MTKKQHLPALVLSLVCAVFLVAAFMFPFLESRMELAFPAWIERVDRWLPVNIHGGMEDWILSVVGVPLGDQYLFGIIRDLWKAEEIFLSVAIFCFSVIFPVSKILLCLIISSGLEMTHATRRRLQSILETTSKWSMADVFIAAMVVIFFKADGFHFEFVPQAGIFCFAVAALGSSLAVEFLKRSIREESKAVGNQLGSIAQKLQARGDGESLELAEELDSIRGAVEQARYES